MLVSYSQVAILTITIITIIIVIKQLTDVVVGAYTEQYRIHAVNKVRYAEITIKEKCTLLHILKIPYDMYDAFY